MRLFGTLYDKTMQLSQHRFASIGLSFISFIEAIFFPIPPEVMLIPMSMSKPKFALRYALYTACASVLGGIIGYGIGYFAFDWVSQLITDWGYQTQFTHTMRWFEKYGVLVIFLAGFSPIPYKVFTICAGVMNMAFLPFVITSFISRFARYVLIAKLSAWGGEKYAEKLRKYIEIIGWAMVVCVVIAYCIYELSN